MNYRTFQSIFIGYTVFCLLILVGNSLFDYPSSDDYAYYIGQSKSSFWEFQKAHYNNWGGRYVPNALLGSFSYDGLGLWLYRGVSISMIVGLFISMFIFSQRVLQISEKERETLYVTSVIFIVFLLSSYSLSQLFYWMPGSVSYNLGIICNLLIWSYIRDIHKDFVKFIGVLFLTFILNGTNEISMLLFNLSLIVIIVFEKIKTGKINRVKSILMVMSLVFFLIAVLAPGNSVRAESINSPNIKSLFFSIPRSVNRGLIFLAEQFYVVIFAVLMLIPYLEKIPNLKINIPLKLKFIVKWACILFPFAVLFVGNFPSYWAMGRIPPQRTVNVIAFFFLFSSLFSLIFYYSNFGYPKVNIKLKYLAPVLIWITFLILPNHLYVNITDFLTGKTYRFAKKMEERIVYIRNSTLQDIEVEPIPIPSEVIFKDLDENKDHYYNRSFAEYFNKRSIVLKKINNER